MLSFISRTPNDVLETIRRNFKERRLAIGYTQEALAKRSGVSLGSLKRFERTGQVSLESLVKIGAILDVLSDFEKLCSQSLEHIESLDEILKEKPKPKRGRQQ